jgi:hypothetical protein
VQHGKNLIRKVYGKKKRERKDAPKIPVSLIPRAPSTYTSSSPKGIFASLSATAVD